MKKIISCLLAVLMLLSCNYGFSFAEEGWFSEHFGGDVKVAKAMFSPKPDNWNDYTPPQEYQEQEEKKEEGFFARAGGIIGGVVGAVGGGLLGSCAAAPVTGTVGGATVGIKSGSAIGEWLDDFFK